MVRRPLSFGEARESAFAENSEARSLRSPPQDCRHVRSGQAPRNFRALSHSGDRSVRQLRREFVSESLFTLLGSASPWLYPSTHMHCSIGANRDAFLICCHIGQWFQRVARSSHSVFCKPRCFTERSACDNLSQRSGCIARNCFSANEKRNNGQNDARCDWLSRRQADRLRRADNLWSVRLATPKIFAACVRFPPVASITSSMYNSILSRSGRNP